VTRRCDVLVVGAGPAGLVAARDLTVAAPSLDVLVLERDRSIGSPVRCGEGVGSQGIVEFIDPTDAPWISRRITRVIFLSPDGTEVRVAEGDVGYILDRSRFEPVLAEQAGRNGAEFVIGCEVTGVERTAYGWRVLTRGTGGEGTIDARLIIAADGVESMVGRWAGLDTRVRSRDMESCAQYVVGGISFDPDAIYLHFGDEIAPGGYAWVFPKGTDVANVGLGIVALRAREGRSARSYLDRYCDAYFPTGVKTGYTVGGVIVSPTLPQIVADGLMLCGDAAHMINPLSGGGIVNAMKSGRLAAEVAATALRYGDASASRLRPYHGAWMRLLGDDHVRFFRIKEALSRFDDPFFDSLARTVNGIPEHRRTLRRIFASALVRNPALLPVVAKYFA
jgi:digeranylgeranylglycerophospholipid reductase